MSHRSSGRVALGFIATVSLVLSVALAAVAVPAQHPVVGRWLVEAEPGGAVWAFQPSGVLAASGPGDIQSEGIWQAVDDKGAFDAVLEVAITGQTLQVLGQVADDGTGVALYVTATEATAPDDWTPWPAESRLLGTPFGMTTEDTPQPTAPPLDCLRPQWVDDVVDWDRCDEVVTPA